MEEQRERLICIVKHTHFPAAEHLPNQTPGARLWPGRRKKYLHPVEEHQQEGTDDDCLEDLPVPAEGSQPWHEELPRHLNEARHHGDHKPVSRRTELYPWNTEHTDSQPLTSKDTPTASLGNFKGVHVLQELWSKLCRIKWISLPPIFKL